MLDSAFSSTGKSLARRHEWTESTLYLFATIPGNDKQILVTLSMPIFKLSFSSFSRICLCRPFGVNKTSRKTNLIRILDFLPTPNYNAHRKGGLTPTRAPSFLGFVYNCLLLDRGKVRIQELCESRGGRPGLPVSNSLYGLCGRKAKATLNSNTRGKVCQNCTQC